MLLLLLLVCAFATSRAADAAASRQSPPQQQQLVVLVHLHPPIDFSQHSALNRALERGHDPHPSFATLARAAARERAYRVMSDYVRASQTAVSDVIRHSFIDVNGSTNGAAGPEAAAVTEQLPRLDAIEHLWIQNTLVVRVKLCRGDALCADSSSRLAAAQAFFERSLVWVPGVRAVEYDAPVVRLVDAAPSDHARTPRGHRAAAAPQTNIALLKAPALWRRNATGAGVVVANIDSGVRYTHEALRDNFRGTRDGSASTSGVTFDYAFWFPPGTDMSKETPDTADMVGHGTHTMGTAVGRNGVGMAPDATWITARAFDIYGAANKSDFLAAAQWVLCPTKADGTGRNCALGADVISNSFGIDRSSGAAKDWQWLTDVVQTWRAAGSSPVFASGNTNGFLCGSVYYPASLEQSVAVGALIGGKSLWGASGKGPVYIDSDSDAPDERRTRIKPDLVAPGVGIRSALSTSDNAYTRLTGTSMATPHVAGALALLLSLDRHEQRRALASSSSPYRSPSTDELARALKDAATRDLSKPFLVPSSCGNTTYREYPNNIYGWGLPDVCRSAAALGFDCADADSREQVAETARDEVLAIE